MRITQHIPAFVSGFKPQQAEFSTVVELLDIPFVARWRNDPEFVRFTKALRTIGSDLLMARLRNAFWVVGYITDPDFPENMTPSLNLDLPLDPTSG